MTKVKHDPCSSAPVQVRCLVDMLKSCSHNGFPVICATAEGERAIMGVVLRQHLLVLLNTRRAFQPSPFVAEVRGLALFAFLAPTALLACLCASVDLQLGRIRGTCALFSIRGAWLLQDVRGVGSKKCGHIPWASLLCLDKP